MNKKLKNMQNFKWRGKSEVFRISNMQNPNGEEKLILSPK